MSSRAILALGSCLVIAGCGNGCSGTPEEAAPRDNRQAQRTEASGGEVDEVAPPVDPGPVPEVRVVGVVDAHERAVTPRVESRGDEPAELSSSVALQRRDGDGWVDVDGGELHLRFACDEEIPDCLTLAPGAVLLPPAWNGTTGTTQCECDGRCPDAPAGTYRFVVRSCSRAHAVEGEPFSLPAGS